MDDVIRLVNSPDTDLLILTELANYEGDEPGLNNDRGTQTDWERDASPEIFNNPFVAKRPLQSVSFQKTVSMFPLSPNAESTEMMYLVGPNGTIGNG